MLNQEIFDEFFDYLCEMKGWDLSEMSKVQTFRQIAIVVDDDEFGTIVAKLIEQDYCKPGDVVRACKEHRIQNRNAAPPPALPPVAPSVCDEQIKFHRLGEFLSSKQRRGCSDCRPLQCACWAAVFAAPVTPEERQAFVDGPARHPLSALGGVPAPDPKEGDLGAEAKRTKSPFSHYLGAMSPGAIANLMNALMNTEPTEGK